jgi:hypothetical protein
MIKEFDDYPIMYFTNTRPRRSAADQRGLSARLRPQEGVQVSAHHCVEDTLLGRTDQIAARGVWADESGVGRC